MTLTMNGAVTKPARDNQLMVATPVAGRIPGVTAARMAAGKASRR